MPYNVCRYENSPALIFLFDEKWNKQDNFVFKGNTLNGYFNPHGSSMIDRCYLT